MYFYLNLGKIKFLIFKMLTIRPATNKDFEFINRLYKEKECSIEFQHIESALVVEDNKVPVAIGVMNGILEATFLVDSKASKRKRLEALKTLAEIADATARRLAFNNYHVFSTSSTMTKLLLRKFKFVK